MEVAQDQKPAVSEKTVRPTKKQRELLSFIEAFIGEHGYSPSYREIMSGLNYTSVATVSLHVNNLIRRGHLRKRDHSARSLELVKSSDQPQQVIPKQLKEAEEKWLVDKVKQHFKEVEASAHADQKKLDELHVLLGALKVLGLEGAANSLMPRLTNLKQLTADNKYVT